VRKRQLVSSMQQEQSELAGLLGMSYTADTSQQRQVLMKEIKGTHWQYS